MIMTNTMLTTNMLAFSRSVQISEALMWAESSNRHDAPRVPIEVIEKGVRGQISEANAKKNEGKSNPQTVDTASIPSGYDELVISFHARFMPAAMKPHASDNSDVAAAYVDVAKTYAAQGGFRYLAERYVWNILNGRFAWRNRIQTDMASVTVRFDGKTIVSQPLLMNLVEPEDCQDMLMAIGAERENLDALVDYIAEGFTKHGNDISVEWRSRLTEGAEVWPSQEYLRKEVADRMSDKGRVYAHMPCVHDGRRIKQASIHSQKIGAALRHIDNWHNDAENGAIAVNPYGGVQETGAVLRPLKKGDAANFYAIMEKPDELLLDLEHPAEEMGGNTHFFFANLLRGGVYGNKDAASKKAKPAAAKGGNNE
jgi:CRISPR-associated protein Csy3